MNLEDLNIKEESEVVLNWYRDELNSLRTNRASISLVEDLPVQYFGSKSPLKHIASISLADSKTIVINPWNKDNLIDIEKTINESDLNLTPNNDGEVIRLILPALTEERRQELVKLLGKKTEEARIKVRKIREKAISEVETKEKSGEISEDDKFKLKEETQQEINNINREIQEIHEKKEKNIMEM